MILINPPVTPPAASVGLSLSAKEIRGSEEGNYEAADQVEGSIDSYSFKSDRVYFDEKQHLLQAQGSLDFYNPLLHLQADFLSYYLKLKKGVAKNVTFQTQEGLYLSSPEVQFSDGKFCTKSSWLTFCSPDDPAWRMYLNKLLLDFNQHRGYLHSAIFYVGNFPVFYIPYLSFPLQTKKQSGFLTPKLGYSSGLGFYFNQPFFLNLAPNYDLTLNYEATSKAGFMLGAEFRYLTPSGSGIVQTNQVFPDQKSNLNLPNELKYRYYWHALAQHSWYFSTYQHSWLTLEYNDASDGNYFADLQPADLSSSLFLSRKLAGGEEGPWGKITAKVQDYQLLQPSAYPILGPQYSILPEVNLDLYPIELFPNFYFNFLAQYVYFTHNLQSQGDVPYITGSRFYLKPELRENFNLKAVEITPKLALSLTYYQTNDSRLQTPYLKPTSQSRVLPILSLDSKSDFTAQVGNKYLHLSPEVFYLYIPQTDQADLPLFDTGFKTNTLDTIFSDNRFSGIDRINSANDVTAGFRGQLNTSEQTLLNFAAGYRFYLTPENPALYGSSFQVQQLVQHKANLFFETWSNPFAKVSSSFNWAYDTTAGRFDNYSLGLNYQADPDKVIGLRLSYQYQQPTYYNDNLLFHYPFINVASYYENQLALGANLNWKLSQRWTLQSEANYDLTSSKFLNWVNGMSYNGGCWGVGFNYAQYMIGTQQERAISFSFILKGLSSYGS